MSDEIAVSAIFQSARTTIDGGWRVSFDLDESQSEEITALAKLKNKSLIIVVTVRDKTENSDYDFNT